MARFFRIGVALLALAVAACAAPNGHGVAEPSPLPLYTVTSTVMQAPGAPPHICFIEPLPSPPIGCGGPIVRGLDLNALHGLQRYRNGVVATPYVRLVGTWHDRALNLTQPPEEASVKDATPKPQCVQTRQAVGADMPPAMQKVTADSALIAAHGIVMLEWGGCNDSVSIVVAVADKDAVDFLTARYGQIQVSGWLQPAR